MKILMKNSYLHSLLAAAFVCFANGIAVAQEGFALDRFDPAVVGSDWFDGDALDFRGHGRGALGVTGSYSRNALVAKDLDGNTLAAPVENQMILHLGAAVNLWDRWRIDMNLPLAVWNEGEAATIGGVTYPAPSDNAMGDLRIGSDLRLVGEYQSAFSLAVGARVRLPTGSRSAYMSDDSTQLGGRLLAAGDLGWFTYSARFGINGHFDSTTVDDVEVGNELTYGATIGARFAQKKALLGVEWYGGAGIVNDSSFDPRTVPQELLGSFSYRIHDVLLGAAAGPGLTDAFGTPEVRGLLRLVWFPVPKKPAPPPPPPPAPPEPIPCPPPGDRDGDAIVDSEDACPMDAGIKSDDIRKNGCPPPNPDLDGDGILNEDDACPMGAGKPNPDPTINGCPRVEITAGELKIKERVEFATNSAEINKSSHELLDAVAEVLAGHPEIELVDIEGHTDDRGYAPNNRKLSQRRADSVKKYLMKKGIWGERMVTSGRGPDVPIASNTTDEGRAANRRVQFHIRRRAAEPDEEIEADEPDAVSSVATP